MESILPVAMFAFVMSITPGPNNIMLTTSGVLFGFSRSIPHMLGITFGFGVMQVACGLGIGSLILSLPSAQLLLKVLSSTYLVYLAWQLRAMKFDQQAQAGIRPMTFIGAAMFQFVNPKAWVMAVTGASAFLPQGQSVWLAVGLLSLIFCAVNLPCISVWAGAGAVLRRHLKRNLWQKCFCGVMVILTLYSALVIWF